MRLRFLIILLFAPTLIGCAERAEALDARWAGVVVDTTLVVSDDPELAALARELLPELTARSGLALVEPVRLVRRTRAELEDFLRFRLDEELPPEREEGIVSAYGLLGLVPAELELKELLLSVYLEQVAGFYDPDSTALFVMDDQDEATMRPLLLHELVHAVQDQAADLAAITASELGNDRAKAAQAAIEGHATVVMLEQMTEELQGRPVDLSEIPNFAGQIRPLLEAARSQYPQLASAPEVIQESLLLPYLEGAGFVLGLWESAEGRPAPFGDLLPQSTEQLMSPERLFGTPDHPIDLLITIDEGLTLHEDVLGMAEVGILLGTHVGEAARDAAQGWGGDRFVVFESEGSLGLVWASVWDSAADRDRFVEALGAGLENFPLPATLEVVEVRGHAGAVLRTGVPVGYTIAATGGGEG